MNVLISPSLDVLTFFIKLALILLAILTVMGMAMKDKGGDKITVKDLNKKFKGYRKILLGALLDKKELKKELKKLAKEAKTSAKGKARVFVLHFKGDIRASAVESFRETITAVLLGADKNDEVVVVLESPGGMVHGYGLAASQMQRIKEAGIKLTVCVDKVAASGGYMMACLADQIIAAPFAILGSVGVVASVPNFNKILKKHDVDYYQITSGKFKRTLTLLGEVTNDGLEKFREEIEETHVLFKDHVKKFRPQVDIDRIATGEHWYGLQAKDLKLIDALGTSDDYLLKASENRVLKEVTFNEKKTIKDKLAAGLSLAFEKVFDGLLARLSPPRF